MSAGAPAQPSFPGHVSPAPSPLRLQAVVMRAGRALVALLFILAGAAKLLAPAPFLAHMHEFGVPAFLFPAVIVLELGAGAALLIGWRVRYAAGALGVFCLLTAVIFHHQFAISAERTLFFKDLAIAGGLWAIAASVTSARRTSHAG